jgi:anti-sigma factor RsiW
MTSPSDQIDDRRDDRRDDPALLLHAYLDGELDAAAALEMERRLTADPALAAERDSIEAVRRMIRDELPREAPSPELRARVERAVGLRRTAQRPTWTLLAASIAATAIVASVATTHLVAPTSSATDAVLASHVRALMAPQPTDVASSDRHTVKPWFNGRIVQAPRVVNLDASGFPLAGARIDVIERSPSPTLVYRRRQHVISLIAVPATWPGDIAPAAQRAEGYNIVRWTEGGTAYWAISDLNGAELAEFAQLFRTTPAER